MGEKLPNIQIDKLGTVAKKNLGFSVVIFSVLFILIFVRPKYPQKADTECCLIENPRNFFKLDCKTVFNNLRPIHKFCVWDFVDSIPKCV